MAATLVGATTIIRFDERSLTVFRKVVLPVPAFPVRKMLVPVCSTNSHAVASSLLCSMFLVCTMLGRRVQWGSGVCGLPYAKIRFFRESFRLCAAFARYLHRIASVFMLYLFCIYAVRFIVRRPSEARTTVVTLIVRRSSYALLTVVER